MDIVIYHFIPSIHPSSHPYPEHHFTYFTEIISTVVTQQLQQLSTVVTQQLTTTVNLHMMMVDVIDLYTDLNHILIKMKHFIKILKCYFRPDHNK